MIDFGPLYQHGHLSIENSVDVAMMDLQDCDVGIQLSADGRIWLCVNSLALIRFKPAREAATSLTNQPTKEAAGGRNPI